MEFETVNTCFILDTYEANGWPKSGYGMSKLAINTYTRVLARNPLAVQNGI